MARVYDTLFALIHPPSVFLHHFGPKDIEHSGNRVGSWQLDGERSFHKILYATVTHAGNIIRMAHYTRRLETVIVSSIPRNKGL